jgi:hypothetical protein
LPTPRFLDGLKPDEVHIAGGDYSLAGIHDAPQFRQGCDAPRLSGDFAVQRHRIFLRLDCDGSSAGIDLIDNALPSALFFGLGACCEEKKKTSAEYPGNGFSHWVTSRQ